MSNNQSRADSVVKHINPTEGSLVSVASKTNGVAVVVINSPPVNSFSPVVADSLLKVFQTLEKDAETKAIVLTGAGKCFVAGADIPSLTRSVASGNKKDMYDFITNAHSIVDLIEAFPKPVVAALNGDALGGGLELAMSCHARIASAKAKVGLPELKLGLIPGMGGTQRLARLAGVQTAVQMITTSKAIPAPKAQGSGIVDAVVKDPKTLIAEASKLAISLATSGKWAKSCDRRVCGAEEAEAICLMAKVQAKKKMPLPHVLGAIECIRIGAVQGVKAGKKAEIETFVQCMLHPVSSALLNVFAISKSAGRQWPGFTKEQTAAALAAVKAPRSVGILGGGTMGAGIAVCYLTAGIPVILKEISTEACAAAVERILSFIVMIVTKRKLPSFAVEHLMRGLTAQTTYDNFDKLDIVIEAAVESVALKQTLMKDLYDNCNKQCILATNTSTIDIDVCAEKVPEDGKSRVIGLHFFSPAPIMPLLEIITSSRTSPETVAVCIKTGKSIKKTNVVVKSCVGFLANRIFNPYSLASSIMIQGGLHPYALDKAIKAFGMPMGPMEMADSVGIDVSNNLRPIFEAGYKGRVYFTNLSGLLVKNGRLGQKSGAGFYKYVNKKRTPDAPALEGFLKQVRQEAKDAGINLPDASQLSPDEIAQLALYPVVNEAARCVAEGVTAVPSDVDTASVMGYGFPAFRGGVFHWGKHVGFDKIAKKLQEASEVWGKDSDAIRQFFAPSEALLALAKK